MPRQIQRRVAPFVLRLDVGTGLLHQKLDHFQLAILSHIAQDHPSQVTLQLDVGAALLDQKLDRFEMAVESCPAQCGVPYLSLISVFTLLILLTSPTRLALISAFFPIKRL